MPKTLPTQLKKHGKKQKTAASATTEQQDPTTAPESETEAQTVPAPAPAGKAKAAPPRAGAPAVWNHVEKLVRVAFCHLRH